MRRLSLLCIALLLLAVIAGRGETAPKPHGATAAAYSADGRTLVLGHGDGSVTMWEGDPLQAGASIPVYKSEIFAVAMSPSAPLLAVSSAKGVSLVSRQSGKVAASLSSARSPMAFNANGTMLVTTTSSGRGIQRWRVGADGRAVLQSADSRVGRVWDISPNAAMLASAKGGWEVRLWDMQPLRGRRIVKNRGAWGGIDDVRFSPDGRMVLLMGSTIAKPPDGFAQAYSTDTGKELKYCAVGTGIYNAAVSADGKLIAAVGSLEGDGALSVEEMNGKYLWSQNTFTENNKVPLGSNSVITFSPDGKTLLTGGQDEPTRLWDARTGELKVTF